MTTIKNNKNDTSNNSNDKNLNNHDTNNKNTYNLKYRVQAAAQVGQPSPLTFGGSETDGLGCCRVSAKRGFLGRAPKDRINMRMPIWFSIVHGIES